MKNISFDNPYILLIAIPLALITLVSFFIAIRKDNKSKSVIISLVLHLVIIFVAAFAMAGTSYTKMITKTELVIVADVSYSADKNLDIVDEYAKSIKDSLPDNSAVALVCFGKDYKLVSPFDSELLSVKDSGVDNTATDISKALEYAGTLFADNTIKRVVLITDAKDTEDANASALVRAVDSLYTLGVQVDAMYIDSNIVDGEREVQVSAVDFTKSTYRGHEATADVLVQSAYETKAIMSLYKDSVKLYDKAVSLTKGFNVVNFDLVTEEDGEFDYEVIINAENDRSPNNNAYTFTQTVSGNLSVLLITTKESDIETARRLYGENAEIDVYYKKTKVPYTVEQLCRYDEIIISETDIRTLSNYAAFINSLDTAVSLFGKSLVTFGNNNIQNKTDETLEKLQDMLPVNFGNSDRDAKLITLLIDASRSMEQAGRNIVAKEAAIKLLGVLDDDDYVSVIAFSGEISIAYPPTSLSKRDEIALAISKMDVSQGTFIGQSLKTAYTLMKDLDYADKQVVLISDGMTYSAEPENAVSVAKDMYAAGIVTTTINVYAQEGATMLQRIATAGRGKYHYIESEKTLDDSILAEVADEITESVVEKRTEVEISKKNDNVLLGVSSLPDIFGFVYAKTKSSADTVLTVEYEKAGGGIVKAPLYAHWDYGNGTVATFTSAMSGEWVSEWSDGEGNIFLTNVVKTVTPDEKIDYPFSLTVSTEGSFSSVEMIPATVKPDALATIEITLPSGEKLTEVLTFDSTKYFYKFATSGVGKYRVNVVYTYSDKTFEAESVFNVSRISEYDSFATFSPSVLHKAIRNRGTVSTDASVPEYEYDEKEVATYTISFTVPFLIIAIVLYVADIIIRKLKWNDIKSLFIKQSKKGAR